MTQFFNTISSLIDKIQTFFGTLYDNLKQAIEELQYWISLLPPALIVSAAIIVVLLVIFRVLGR